MFLPDSHLSGPNRPSICAVDRVNLGIPSPTFPAIATSAGLKLQRPPLFAYSATPSPSRNSLRFLAARLQLSSAPDSHADSASAAFGHAARISEAFAAFARQPELAVQRFRSVRPVPSFDWPATCLASCHCQVPKGPAAFQPDQPEPGTRRSNRRPCAPRSRPTERAITLCAPPTHPPVHLALLWRATTWNACSASCPLHVTPRQISHRDTQPEGSPRRLRSPSSPVRSLDSGPSLHDLPPFSLSLIPGLPQTYTG